MDVANELGAARSTAHRMVSTLAKAGLLERHATDKSFVAGPALIQLAQVLTNKGDIRVEIEPTLSRLAEQTGETTHYLILQDQQVLFVAGVESQRIIRAVSRVGHRLPAHITSAGKCLLAALAPEKIDQMFPRDGTWDTGTDFAIHDRDHLIAELAQIANRGWALNNEESEPGVIGVSTLVRGQQGNVLGAVTVSGPAERMRPRISEIVATLRAASEDFTMHRGRHDDIE
ncbi:IclR family acetate operon transcriptional repressor [Arthrobacter ginsengisoli]|uniref:IclR family acetate operon transcriptional repressor n=2 Tax=Arthrobacter ginsengisoli TaxID=1356565 RepID=A0ABU1UDP3_9MICC|nr:IclR family acetate operon transcriptional repressor [Arthrobacter ginsengisoli]